MQLDSKESDIEQLREKLNDLQQRMDNSSVTSLQPDETDSNIAGKVSAVETAFSSTSTDSSLNHTIHLQFKVEVIESLILPSIILFFYSFFLPC